MESANKAFLLADLVEHVLQTVVREELLELKGIKG